MRPVVFSFASYFCCDVVSVCQEYCGWSGDLSYEAQKITARACSVETIVSECEAFSVFRVARKKNSSTQRAMSFVVATAVV